MNKVIYIVFCLFLWSISRNYAQTVNGVIQGYVTDEKGIPIEGATVSEYGSNNRTSTDQRGYFSLKIKKNNVRIVINLIGFESVRIDTAKAGNFNISLKKKAHVIDEVNVYSTGYQRIPKERSTGSFLQIDQKEIDRLVSPSILQRLDGQIGGIFFDKRNNGVGKTSDIAIRGRSTIHGNSSPLIVLDNFPYDGDINSIDPNSIESITVLRDAAASSIWGVRASNGVIVLTSKKGIRGKKLHVEVNANATIEGKQNINNIPLLNAKDQIELEEKLFELGLYTQRENSNIHEAISPLVELLIDKRDNKINEDEYLKKRNNLLSNNIKSDLDRFWYKQAQSQQSTINLRGGAEKLSYMLSSSYDSRSSELDATSKRFMVKSENTVYLNKWLTFDFGMHFINTLAKAGRPSWSGIQRGHPMYGYYRLKDGNGNAESWLTNYRTAFLNESMDKGLLDWKYRPLEDYRYRDNRTETQEVLLKSGLTLAILDGLKFRIDYQYLRGANKTRDLQRLESYGTRDYINQFTEIQDNGTLFRNVPLGDILDGISGTTVSHSGRGMFQFDRKFGIHEISAIGGMDIRQVNNSAQTFREYGYNNDILTLKPVNYTTDFLLYHTPSYRSKILNMSYFNERIDRMISYYANANYTYNGKFSISASIRKDGSNLFGIEANNRLIPLWSTGLSYNLSNEPFFRNNLLSHLKLRATYGVNGNVDNAMSAKTTMSYSRSVDRFTGMRFGTITSPPNPMLRWEKNYIVNAGIDFAMLNNRLRGNIDLYAKRSTDLIGDAEIDPTTGVTITAIKFGYRGNVAAMKGKGLDMQLETKNIVGDFNWSTLLNYSNAFTKVTDYFLAQTSGSSFVGSGSVISPIPGYPVFSIFSYPWAGLNPENGNPRGLLNGEPSESYADLTTKSSIQDLLFKGSAIPTHFGNIRNNFSFKGFEASINIAYRLGHYFRSRSINYGMLLPSGTGHPDYTKRWKQPGDESLTNIPSFVYPNISGRDNFYLNSDVLVQKASSIRATDIVFSYMPKISESAPWKKIGFDQVKFTFYISNLGTIWKSYHGNFDPDISSEMQLPKVYVAGIKLYF